MKNKIKLASISLAIVFILLTPNINAEITKMNDGNELAEKTEADEEITCLGSIYGTVHAVGGYAPPALPFALVTIGIHRVRTNLAGNYKIGGLPLGRTYTVTAKKFGYHKDTKEVALTSEEPHVNLNFYLEEKDDLTIKKNTPYIYKPACIGYIYGIVGNSHVFYGLKPYPFALVDVGIIQTRCGLFGRFILFLPLGRTYNVTAKVRGFKPLIEEVGLFLDDPFREIWFDFYLSEPTNIKSKGSNHWSLFR